MTDQNDTPPAKTHGLSFIAPRQTRRVLAARNEGYTKRVSVLRVALPVGAALVLVVLLVWPLLTARRLSDVVMKNIPDLVIDNLHFTGLDSQNQPYSVSAIKATRVVHGTNLYDLDKPEGEITLSSGAWVAGKAEQGRLDETNHQLWLGGHVQLFHDKGFQFTSDEAEVDMKNRIAWGKKPVVIQGDFGVIHGQGFELIDSGATIVVKGPAKAILTPRHTSQETTPQPHNPDLHPAAPSDKPLILNKGKE